MIRDAASPSVYVVGALRGLPARPRRADGPRAFRSYAGRLRASTSGMNPLAVTAVANAIQTQEGFYPGSVSYTNNNPGNLMYAGQAGATAGPGGFAVFSTYAAGYQALQNQITLDAVRGTDANGMPVNTLGDLISSWAPASAGNDTASYISSVTQQTGYSASDDLLSLGSGTVPDSSAYASQISDVMQGSTSPLDLLAGVVNIPSGAWLAIGVSVAALVLYSRR